ncbi:putative transposase [Borreliella spielmanii]|uniref:Transposase n=1 Tax=Borreliella spielmanii TaxID=88916 RepID=A0ABR6P7G6_9SPIR|nr:putative transposase [Borreliella spielmanii]
MHDRDINAALNLKAYYYKEIKTKARTARSKACGPLSSG